MVTVNGSASVVVNEYAMFPQLQNRSSTHRLYRFLTPGLSFMLFVGKAIPRGAREVATSRGPNHLILISGQIEENTLTEMARTMSKVRIAENLKKTRP